MVTTKQVSESYADGQWYVKLYGVSHPTCPCEWFTSCQIPCALINVCLIDESVLVQDETHFAPRWRLNNHLLYEKATQTLQ